jgi:hypothetical protein
MYIEAVAHRTEERAAALVSEYAAIEDRNTRIWQTSTLRALQLLHAEAFAMMHSIGVLKKSTRRVDHCWSKKIAGLAG